MATIRDRYVLDIDTKGAERSIFSVQNALKGLAGAFALNELRQGIQSVVAATTQFERYRTVLATYLGSQQAANSELQRLRILARELPQDLQDIMQAFTVLTSRGIDTTSESIRALSNIATANNKSLEQLGEALADALVGEFERLKEFGVKVRQENGQLVADIGNGNQLIANSYEEIVEQIIALGEAGGRFGDAARNNAGTLNQALSNLRGAIFDAQVAIGEALTPGFINLAEAISNALEQSGPFLEFIGTLAGGLATAAATAISLLADNFYLLAAAIAAVGISGFITGLSAAARRITLTQVAMSYVNGTALQLDGRLKTLVKAFFSLLGVPRILRLIGSTIVRIASFFTPVRAAITAVLILFNSLTNLTIRLGEQNSTVGTAMVATFNVVARALGSVVSAIRDGVVGALNKVREVLSPIADLIADIFEFIGRSIDKLSGGAISEEIDRLNELRFAETFENEGNAVEGALDRTAGAAEDASNRISDALENATNRANQFIENLENSTSDAQFEFDALNMNPLEEQIARIRRTIQRDLAREIASLEQLRAQNPGQADQINAQIERVRLAAQQTADAQARIATAAYEQQRSFAYGWRTAFEEYAENATNAANIARDVFQKTTQGMEDAIVNFAKTGKFEFKSFIASILEDLLRAQIRQTLASVFRLPIFGGGRSGGGGGLFGGFFATGGMIPPGRFGVVGENGPELVTGPANVTPNLGVQSIVYNINAVDALSFKQLVAQDPGFIHAVASQGARTVPVRR